MSTPPPRGRWPFARRREAVVETAETVVGGPQPPPPNRLGVGLLLGLALVLLAAGIIAGVWFVKHRDDSNGTTTVTTAAPTTVAVPKVVGMTESKALVALASAGFKPRERFTPTKKPSRLVVSQAPQADTQVARGADVTIVVDSGAPKVTVPNVQGIAAAEATAALQKQGLDAKQTQVASTKPPGTVVSQAPAAGSSVAKGSAVTLGVAKAKPVAVPDVTGQTETNAAATLKSAGLASASVTVPSGEAKGTVVAQSPAAGSQAAGGSKVRINVSDGTGTSTGTSTATTTTRATTTAPASTTPTPSKTATVPDLSGTNEQQAVQSLATAGLRASIVFVPGQDPQGTVVGQGKPAGSTIPRDSHVQINVSTGPSPKPAKAIPDTVGQTLTQAVSTLNAAGFKLIYVKVTVPAKTQAGKVVEQQPSAATSVPQGVQVLVYLGAFRA